LEAGNVTDNPKFCVNCEHFLAQGAQYLCRAPQNILIGRNLVTGDLRYHALFCADQRDRQNLCGPEGKWFEPRKGK